MTALIKFKVEKLIYLIRGERVMLDSDLAEIYGVETKYLNRQVKRNASRFPEEFMFQLSKDEIQKLKDKSSDFNSSIKNRKYSPFVFTEFGIAMLSGVLSTDLAISVNLSIIKTFIRLRKALANDEELSDKIMKLEKGTNALFKIVLERIENVEEDVITLKNEVPTLSSKRKRIGLGMDKK